MTLVDTSVWVNHLRSGDLRLQKDLSEGLVLTHPFVIGELACGNLKERKRILTELERLPAATPAMHDEVLALLDQHKLWGRGIGWIDAHLLASALLTHCRFWTLDQQLMRAAVDAGVAVRQAGTAAN